MRVPLRSLNLSLVEAAARQTNAAIDAIQKGKFDVAITLAGAAEGMLKKANNKLSCGRGINAGPRTVR